LSPAFGEALYRHTQGHALFTVEMLRGLQERGDLVQDTDGFWVEGAPVQWAQLPARVEGIIGERLGRLPAALYEMLKVACVMGDEFIAEVVAQVLKAEEREVVRQSSGVLDKQHHLVRSQGGQRLDSQRLSHYRFQHILVQSYLYQTVDEAERAYLHEDVGYGLEQLYAGQTDVVAVHLARHFREAGLTAKALDYSQQAGEQAARRWANQEAVQFFNDALTLLKTLPELSERGQQELRLHMALAEAQWKAGQIPEAMDTFQQAAAIARTLGATEELARAALGFVYVRYRFDLPAEPAVRLLEEARNALGEKDSVLRARVLGNLTRALFTTGMPERLEALSEQAIDIARRVGDPSALFDTLYTSVIIQRRPEKIEARIAAVDEMLRLTQEMDDRDSAMQVYPVRILAYLEFGDIQAVDESLESGSQLAEKSQVPFTLHLIQVQQAARAILAGDFAKGEQLARQARETGQQMQIETVDGIFGVQMFTIQREKGTLRRLTPVIQSFVEHNPEATTWRPGLALIYSDLGFEPEARAQFERLAANDFAGIPQDALWVGSMAYLSEVCAFLGDAARADILYRLLLPYARLNIVVGGGSACFGVGSRYLGLLAATMSRWAEAEQHFEAALETNASMGAKPWLAHTQAQYAAMLLARGQPGDRGRAHSLLHEALVTADELGMKFLVEKVETLKQ
jgi:tetratricopeptide (TPR) repeat protein